MKPNCFLYPLIPVRLVIGFFLVGSFEDLPVNGKLLYYPALLCSVVGIYKVDILMLLRVLPEPILFLCCIAILFLFNNSTIVMTIARGTTAIIINNKTISISQVSIFMPKFPCFRDYSQTKEFNPLIVQHI